MLIAGVDEAGRGCVIGPLVVAGVAVREENLNALLNLGVKDSKLLSPKKREGIASIIMCSVENLRVIEIAPSDIDQVVESGRKLHKLNRLEAQIMSKIIAELKPDVAYVDAADVLEDRFKHHIEEDLSFNVKIVSKHKADRAYPIVSAASIVAKVKRDEAIATLKSEYGDFGSGYLADAKTKDFLKHWLQSNQEYPDCIRKSWKPAKEAKMAVGFFQKKLV
jgi:ribonuclease HII